MQTDHDKASADLLLENLVKSSTDLNSEDITILKEMAHSLPAISNLEHGDTYINILTKSGESMVVAQYRHRQCDLYKRNIVGQIVKRADEPAVYQALEHGMPGRGLIGVIDEGRIVVRHTVSPIYNDAQRVIGSLTYEYPDNHGNDTEPIRLRLEERDKRRSLLLRGEFHKVASYMQDGFLTFDSDGVCLYTNEKARGIFKAVGVEENIVGKKYADLNLIAFTQDMTIRHSLIKNETRIGDSVFEENIHTIWENGTYEGVAVILRDKTRIHQMEDELAYRVATINEIHHRVKNNLQTIISLVGLEAAQSHNKEVVDFSKTIIGRICSISVTYDLLAHTGTDSVNLQMMLYRILEESRKNACGCLIQTNVAGDQIELAASSASTVALIANELVQNSLKYAFKDCSKGRIEMYIEAGDEYSWITVRDNGCGFQKKTSQKEKGLGLRLIDSLVKSSLKGQIEITSNEQGTITRFSFKNSIAKK